MVQPIFYSNNLKDLRSLFTYLDQIFIDLRKLCLSACIFGSNKISNLKCHKIALPQDLVLESELILGQLVLILLKINLTCCSWDSLQGVY